MVDLGIYNFIKNELAQGQSKEAISATLQNKGMSEADIAAAFDSVEHNAIPESPIHSFAGVPQPATVTKFDDTQSLWDEFRGVFWKYILGSFILGLVSHLLNIGFISILTGVAQFILLILIAVTIYRAAKAFDGARHIFLGILGFFFPSAAYYYVYRIAKKRYADLSLNIFEWIFVVVGLIAYFLIIIGVGLFISTIFLIHAVPNPAIDKSNDAAVKSSLDSIRVESAIYYDKHSTYGTSTDCISGGMFTDHNIVLIMKDVTRYSPGTPVCRSRGTDFVIQQQLVEDHAYWCIDSKGTSKKEMVALPESAFSCS